jgi:hypothetical protein
MRSTTNKLSTGRGLAVLGGVLGVVLFVAVGVALGAVPRSEADGSGAARRGPGVTPPPAGADAAAAAAADPAPTAPPATVAPEPTTATPPTTAKASPRKVPTTTAAPPLEAATPAPTPVPPAPAKLPPGRRIEPTGAQVQAAIAALHGRIPLFQPTAAQLRTFADAACTSFDQGQTFAQVQSTVQQAVSYVQGASLSAADADFAVRVVLELRCPGWLP